MPWHRALGLVFLAAWAGFGCQKAPTDAELRRAEEQALIAALGFEPMTQERCGVGFQGEITTLPGDVVQEPTAQTTACPGDECPGRALAIISPSLFFQNTCAQIREKLKAKPIVDAWGAQARVYCTGDIVQSLSAGADGKLGTCDDLSRFSALKRHSIRQ